jgi:hypothetical protein
MAATRFYESLSKQNVAANLRLAYVEGEELQTGRGCSVESQGSVEGEEWNIQKV